MADLPKGKTLASRSYVELTMTRGAAAGPWRVTFRTAIVGRSQGLALVRDALGDLQAEMEGEAIRALRSQRAERHGERTDRREAA